LNNAHIITEIQKTRSSLIDMINTRFDFVISQLLNQENFHSGNESTEFERSVPLATNPSLFLKKKPMAVFIGDERIALSSWKDVYKLILHRCNQDPNYHDRLMNLRGKTVGKMRAFLSDNKEGMTHPARIDDELYAETHYSSHVMMRVLVNRILAEIEYDCSNIKVVLKL